MHEDHMTPSHSKNPSRPVQLPAAADRSLEQAPTMESTDRRLTVAIARLATDEIWFTGAVAEYLESLAPIEEDGPSQQQTNFPIESGTFTAESLAAKTTDIARGGLQLKQAEAWLPRLYSTMSLDDAIAFLELDEDAVRTAVADGRLYAVEISGRLRFPDWQFDVGQVGKVLSHLAALIEILAPRWAFQHIAGFMSTRQSSLVAVGRKTPTSWLVDGGQLEPVRANVESSYWR